MEVITLDNVHFAYNSAPVIRGVSYNASGGSFTAMLGPNGSGKTTLIRLINGMLTPKQGRVDLMGHSTSGMKAVDLARRMAYVPQREQNVFASTVFDTILLGRNPYIKWTPGKEDRRIVSEIMVKLSLDEIALKDINTLSGGQRQRVFIARALAQQPEVILLDEPTANLDLRHQHEVLQLLMDLSRKGITLVMAIHDLNLALKYCTDFMVLNEGMLVAHGGKEVFSRELIEKIYKVEVRIIQEKDQTFIIPLKPL